MKRTQLLLVVVLVVMVTIGWWFLLIRPKNADIAAADQRVAALVSDRQSLRSQIDGLNRIKDSEVTFIFAIGEMETSVPENPDLDDFLEDVTFLASRSGIEISTLSAAVPAPVVGTPGLFEIDVTLSAQGGFFEALGFLFGLEDLDRLMRVDTISFTQLSSDDEEGTENEEGITPRVDPGLVQVELGGKLFTRSSVTVETPPPPTTTTLPPDTSSPTTTVPPTTTTTAAP